jgi:hypothetical protein
MLGDHLMDYPSYCTFCGTELNPFLIPPLLNKPIARDGIIRSIWGNAFSAISSASELVIVGYSFPLTDFYAQWLFRSAMERNREFARMRKRDCRIWIVNPDNKDPSFIQRMGSIFLTGYEDRFKKISEISDLLKML